MQTNYGISRLNRRHPCDRMPPEHRKILEAYLRLRLWRRHPAPFSKTRAGLQRRQARRFVLLTQHTIQEMLDG